MWEYGDWAITLIDYVNSTPHPYCVVLALETIVLQHAAVKPIGASNRWGSDSAGVMDLARMESKCLR